MQSTPPQICIYCKSSNPEKFKSVEQTPTLVGCVCDDCNSHFGTTIDQHLTREIIEGIACYNKGILSSQARPQSRLHITLESVPEHGEFGGMKVAIDGSAATLMLLKRSINPESKDRRVGALFQRTNPGIHLSEDVDEILGGNLRHAPRDSKRLIVEILLSCSAH